MKADDRPRKLASYRPLPICSLKEPDVRPALIAARHAATPESAAALAADS